MKIKTTVTGIQRQKHHGYVKLNDYITAVGLKGMGRVELFGQG